jgi:hypothetical protein
MSCNQTVPKKSRHYAFLGQEISDSKHSCEKGETKRHVFWEKRSKFAESNSFDSNPEGWFWDGAAVCHLM